MKPNCMVIIYPNFYPSGCIDDNKGTVKPVFNSAVKFNAV